MTGPAHDGRRPAATDFSVCLDALLDETDHGMLLVDADARVLYLNRAARSELDAAHPLSWPDATLRPRRPQDLAVLAQAVRDATEGRRSLVGLGDPGRRVTVSVVPPPSPAAAALLVLGKRRLCGDPAVQAYARSIHLTPAETRVLERLCDGSSPAAMARELGVALSTVRTQISSLRAKSGEHRIRDVVRQVALLPPLGAADGAAG